MNFRDLVGRRVLISPTCITRIIEVRVVEVSPNGKYAKVSCKENGEIREWWIDGRSYTILDVLEG